MCLFTNKKLQTISAAEKTTENLALLTHTGNNEKLTLFVKELNCCYFKVLQAIECAYWKKANKGTLKQVMPSGFP